MNTELLFMQRCLELAALSRGYTAPNPMVGAVLVHDGRIIGEGRHEQYGQAHAEVNCLDSVAAADRHLLPSATMYVSLEPCAHYGRTPPCALRIIAEGIRRVVICNPDPFAAVAGRGIKLLEEAGIQVSSGVMAAAGEWLNRRFFTFHRKQRPYIILKWAQAANGIFAPSDRSRLQLSDAFSQQLSHKWRTEEAAILVGGRTALHDNPRLQSRLWPGPQPLRIAISPQQEIPADYHLMDGSSPTWIIQGRRSEQQGHTVYKRMPSGAGVLPALMQELYTAGKLSLIVEGGIHLLEQFIAAGLWDEARIFVTPAPVAGGLQAPVLRNVPKAADFPLDQDILELYLNHSVPYTTGMDL